MSFSLSNRALLRGMLAGAVVLTGTACSRSDRAKSGPDNSAAVVADSSGAAAQPSSSGTVTGATTSAPSNAPRAETAPSDTDAAGYRSMERDTANTPNEHSDSARVTPDTSVSQTSPGTSDSATAEMSAGDADTAAAGYAEMARDTSTVADQADTAAANGDVALRATVDTSSEASADGNFTTNETADETADEQVIRPEDRETVAASETPTDEVGASAMGGNVTGVEAVALMTREGLRCAVVDPETNAARWDMSSTPVALNPCGMGSMILSRIWTEGSAGQE